jgi:hypothetical protein
MKLVALLNANIIEDQLTILFNLLTVEYIVSILWHQNKMVGNLTIAMAKTVQFQRISHPGYRRLAPPMAMVPNQAHFTKKVRI